MYWGWCKTMPYSLFVIQWLLYGRYLKRQKQTSISASVETGPWKTQMPGCSGPASTSSLRLFWGGFLILFSMNLSAISATGCCQLICEDWIQPNECRRHIVKNLSMAVLVGLCSRLYLHAVVSLVWAGSTWTVICRALRCDSLPHGLIPGSSSVSMADCVGNCELPLIRLLQNFPGSQQGYEDKNQFMIVRCSISTLLWNLKTLHVGNSASSYWSKGTDKRVLKLLPFSLCPNLAKISNSFVCWL